MPTILEEYWEYTISNKSRNTNRKKVNVSQVGLWIPVPGKVLGIVSRSNSLVIPNPTGLHVDIFRCWCFHSLEVYSVDSSEMVGRFFEVLMELQPVISQSQPVHLQLNRRFFLDIVGKTRILINYARNWVFPDIGSPRGQIVCIFGLMNLQLLLPMCKFCDNLPAWDQQNCIV